MNIIPLSDENSFLGGYDECGECNGPGPQFDCSDSNDEFACTIEECTELFGDVDENGLIQPFDASYILQYLLDEDLLNSLKINPDDAYVLNYLAYSWLERNHKIDDSIKMLEKAHLLKKNDPFILDSVGWAYYLIGDTKKAEYFLKKAIQIMPNDPVVNDHYGDVLWKLNRKIQAKYYWQSVLSFEKTEEDMKKKINIKLLKGLNKI